MSMNYGKQFSRGRNFSKQDLSDSFLGAEHSWMMVEEAATFLGKAQNTIINWCKSGKIAAVPTEFGNKVSFHVPTKAVLAMQEVLKAKETERICKKLLAYFIPIKI